MTSTSKNDEYRIELLLYSKASFVSARNGTISFNQTGAPVYVTLSNPLTPGPLNGVVESTGTDINISVTSDSNIQLGNVTGTGSVLLSLNGTGDISSSGGTITTPALTVGANGGSIGTVSTLMTAANTITPISGFIETSVYMSNNLPFGSTTLTDGWELTNTFYLYTAGSTTVGSITQDSGTNGSIEIEELVGTLQVEANATITARQGNVVMQIDTPLGGSIEAGANSQIAASAFGTGDVSIGSLTIQVGTGTTYACGTIPNFTYALSAPPPVCGTLGFTANSPNNSALAIGRAMVLYSPNVGSLTLGGGVILNALQ